ncbi:type IV secretory system conjugative DNA transfer family protein [Alloalcanivorax mobilis]|uniref:type IV secretory system conjugative DNA transfer family protein n=1 Tax=Alloalcanivorax mobilis TaxID=2019569 RepID=UPI000C75DB7C|nr:type IV secretory system conjugative DNA transfer family protein [Alloalcanivorax mobilis]
MAVNKNPALDARHTLVVGATGAGKSQAIKNLIPRRGVRVIAFDPDGDHGCHEFASLPAFARELKRADRSGRNYRLAYTGATSPDDLQRFCSCVWAVLDGNRDTHVILEEAAQFTSGSGPATDALANLYLRSRKYGGILYGVGQRAAEIPSTMRMNSAHKYIGVLQGSLDAKAAMAMTDIPVETLLKTPPKQLRFWRKSDGEAPEYLQFKYLG